MIIELNVTWTFPTPPVTTPYSVDIYYRLVGTTTYTVTTITNGESGSATITVYNSTSDTISDRNIDCILDYEGYVVPTCAGNAVDQRVSFSTIESDITNYMQCRGIEAECNTGGIIAIIPDPNPSLIFSVADGVSIDLSSFTGSGDSSLLPSIVVQFTNPSATTSTIQYIGITGVDFSAGFNSTTEFDLIGVASDLSSTLTMTPRIVTACGSLDPINIECYTGDSIYLPFASTDGGIMTTCTNNETVQDYNAIFDNKLEASIGDVTITENYSCCQNSTCKIYGITNTGVSDMPFFTSPILGYISGITGEFTLTPAISTSLQVYAVEGTIKPYAWATTNVATLNLMLWSAAHVLSGGININEIGPCS